MVFSKIAPRFFAESDGYTWQSPTAKTIGTIIVKKAKNCILVAMVTKYGGKSGKI